MTRVLCYTQDSSGAGPPPPSTAANPLALRRPATCPSPLEPLTSGAPGNRSAMDWRFTRAAQVRPPGARSSKSARAWAKRYSAKYRGAISSAAAITAIAAGDGRWVPATKAAQVPGGQADPRRVGLPGCSGERPRKLRPRSFFRLPRALAMADLSQKRWMFGHGAFRRPEARACGAWQMCSDVFRIPNCVWWRSDLPVTGQQAAALTARELGAQPPSTTHELHRSAARCLRRDAGPIDLTQLIERGLVHRHGVGALPR